MKGLETALATSTVSISANQREVIKMLWCGPHLTMKNLSVLTWQYLLAFRNIFEVPEPKYFTAVTALTHVLLSK